MIQINRVGSATPIVRLLVLIGVLCTATVAYADPLSEWFASVFGSARPSGHVTDLDTKQPIAGAWVIGTRSECFGLAHCSTECVEVRVAVSDVNGAYSFDTRGKLGNYQLFFYRDGYWQDYRRRESGIDEVGMIRTGSGWQFVRPDPITHRISYLARLPQQLSCFEAPQDQQAALEPVDRAIFAEATRIARYSEQQELARAICRRCPSIAADPERDRFEDALAENDVATVSKLVKSGFDPNRLIDGKQPAIVIVALRGRIDMIGALVSLGADIDHSGVDQQSALLLVVEDYRMNRATKLAVVDALAAAGADAGLSEPGGDSPLIAAVRRKDIEVLEKMFDHGAKADQYVEFPAYPQGAPALEVSDDPKVVELLLRHGANVNLRDGLGQTTLHNVSKPEIARLLIANGADVNAESRDGVTPLMHAIMNWDSLKGPNQAPFVEIADLLVDSGARLDLKSGASLPWYINKEALQRRLRELADRHKK